MGRGGHPAQQAAEVRGERSFGVDARAGYMYMSDQERPF